MGKTPNEHPWQSQRTIPFGTGGCPYTQGYIRDSREALDFQSEESSLATQYVPSGYVALMIATTPIWTATLEGLLDLKRPSGLLVLGLLVGLLGILALNLPKLGTGLPTHLLAFSLLLISPLMWASGTIYTQRHIAHVEPVVVSSYQQLFGGLGFLLISFGLGEAWHTPTPPGWASNLYLIVFGSLTAYTSYILAVRLLPLSLVTTYAYVNPVIALLLGWVVLREPLGIWTWIGGALVLLGVGLVFCSRMMPFPLESFTAGRGRR